MHAIYCIGVYSIVQCVSTNCLVIRVVHCRILSVAPCVVCLQLGRRAPPPGDGRAHQAGTRKRDAAYFGTHVACYGRLHLACLGWAGLGEAWRGRSGLIAQILYRTG